MLTFCKVATLVPARRIVPISRHTKSLIDKIREQLYIPCKEMDSLAKEMVGREDLKRGVSGMSEGEGQKLLRWLRQNQNRLQLKYKAWKVRD